MRTGEIAVCGIIGHNRSTERAVPRKIAIRADQNFIDLRLQPLDRKTTQCRAAVIEPAFVGAAETRAAAAGEDEPSDREGRGSAHASIIRRCTTSRFS